MPKLLALHRNGVRFYQLDHRVPQQSEIDVQTANQVLQRHLSTMQRQTFNSCFDTKRSQDEEQLPSVEHGSCPKRRNKTNLIVHLSWLMQLKFDQLTIKLSQMHQFFSVRLYIGFYSFSSQTNLKNPNLLEVRQLFWNWYEWQLKLTADLQRQQTNLTDNEKNPIDLYWLTQVLT